MNPGDMLSDDAPTHALEGDPHSPRYYRLRETIRNRMRSGELKPGDRLPTEQQIEDMYGVSRTTVRVALRELEEQGLILRRQGYGTFVARPRLYRELSWLTTLSEDMEQVGLDVTAELLAAEDIVAPPEAAVALDLPGGDKVRRVQRRRLVSGEPLAVDESHYPRHVAAHLKNDDLRAASILHVLEEKYGFRLEGASFRLEAQSATQGIAELLDISPGTPILVVARTTRTADGIPIDYARMYYRGDRIGYSAEVYRRVPPMDGK